MMLRRSMVPVLVACLLGGASIAPADAKRKPRKPPVTFQESGSLAVGYPGDFFAEANVTKQAFVQTCAIPPSQGTDGYVIALPDEITAVATDVTITGADAVGIHDLDLFFYDDSCSPTGSINTTEVNEFGPMPAGTRYVVVTAFFGVEVTFDFEATETRR